MFTTVRKNVSLVALAEKLFNMEVKPSGENTYEFEDKTCPFCGHKDCFKVKEEEGNYSDSFFKCFSCDEHGDVTTLVQKKLSLEPVEAAKWLAKEYDFPLPTDASPIQEIFNLAALYYYNCMREAGTYPELKGLTPYQYQVQIRKHNGGLENFFVGWSDGGVVEYLRSVGIDEQMIQDSGLVGKKGGDFLPSKCFIYPHLVRGRVSHFTFKDPMKQKEYQIPNKHKLNGHSFYNSDSISKPGPVIVVEGENDCITVAESGWSGGVIACIGQISGSQLEWLTLHLAGREVITIFDPDAAGDKYREKVGKLRKHFAKLVQLKITTGEDIDEYLRNGRTLDSVFEMLSEPATSAPEAGSEESIEVEGGSGVIVKDGCYYKVRYKEGVEFHVKMTNFTILLRNIFVRGVDREREVVIVRYDGRTSEPLIIPSEAKVSLRPFKTLLANAIDASFYGKEDDLNAMWEYVYSQSPEKEVTIPEMVGRLERYKGWIFRDCFISDSGGTEEIDEEGVIWTGGKTYGLKPMSLDMSSPTDITEDGSIPMLNRELTFEERKEFLGSFMTNLSLNFNTKHERLGDVLTIMGWLWASVYSDVIFGFNRSFPFLKLWGDKDRGKTTIIRWLLDAFNMGEQGYTTISNLNSGVGWGRKMAYFSSLPMCVDELRANRETTEFYGTLRGYYDRAARVTGVRDTNKVRTQQVRSSLILGSQDMITDDATRSRCIIIRIPKNGRDKDVSFNWIDSRKGQLSSIGYHWISTYNQFTPSILRNEIRALAETLRKLGLPSRTSLCWSVAGFFAEKLAKEYFPHFNYMEYLCKEAVVDMYSQYENDMINNFFEVVEGIQAGDNAPISGDHIKVEGDALFVWFTEVFRIVSSATRHDTAEPFSKRALLEAIREEPYFMEECRTRMGMGDHLRRVIKLDLTKTPEVLQNIGSFSSGN